MKCKDTVLCFVSLSLVLIVGCSKDSKVSKSTANPFAGTYAATYSESTRGSLTIAVEVNGNTSVAITDSTEGVYSGDGSTDTGGKLNAIAISQRESDSVAVSGQFVTNGGNVICTGSLAGSITVSSWTAQKIAGADENAFAGNYSGTHWDTFPEYSEEGPWAAVIIKDGRVSGTAWTYEDTIDLTGTTSLVGISILQGTGGGVGKIDTVLWSGTFRLENGKVVCSGEWSSSSGWAGEWKGQKM